MPRLISLSVAVILAFSVYAPAQSTNTAAAGGASGSDGSVSFSVGQVVYQFHTGTNGSVAAGIQQPYEIQVVTALENAGVINILTTAYPNPTHSYLTLCIEEWEISNLSYQLYDMQGTLLKDGQISANLTQLDMGGLPSAIYFVYISRENNNFHQLNSGQADQQTNPIKIFKIIKN